RGLRPWCRTAPSARSAATASWGNGCWKLWMPTMPRAKGSSPRSPRVIEDREAAVAAAPWNVIEDTFVFGTPDEMPERLGAFLDGGITLPILTPIVPPDRLGEMIEALAPG